MEQPAHNHCVTFPLMTVTMCFILTEQGSQEGFNVRQRSQRSSRLRETRHLAFIVIYVTFVYVLCTNTLFQRARPNLHSEIPFAAWTSVLSYHVRSFGFERRRSLRLKSSSMPLNSPTCCRCSFQRRISRFLSRPVSRGTLCPDDLNISG